MKLAEKREPMMEAA